MRRRWHHTLGPQQPPSMGEWGGGGKLGTTGGAENRWITATLPDFEKKSDKEECTNSLSFSSELIKKGNL